MNKRSRRQLTPESPVTAANPYDKLSKLMMVIVLIIIFSAIAVAWWHRQPRTNSIQHNSIQQEILSWPREKVLASSENTKVFIEARLAYLASKMPDDLILPNTAPESVKLYLQKFVESEEMELTLGEINKERNSRRDKILILKLFPDIHFDSTTGILLPASQERQNWITAALHQQRVSLIFVEGTEGYLTWKSLHEQIKKFAREKGVENQVPESLDEFKQWILAMGYSSWFYQFLDDPNRRLFGFDAGRISQIISILMHIQPPPELNLIYSDTVELLNYHYREQLILARCIHEMRANNLTQAAIVIGEGHLDTFPKLCQSWGIELQVIKPPHR